LSSPFLELDYLYTPSKDVAADLEYFTSVLGAEVGFAVEGMGARVDRSNEHLGASDRFIIAVRKALLEATRTVEAGGQPPGTDPETYRRIRPYDAILAPDERWEDAFAQEMVAKW